MTNRLGVPSRPDYAAAAARRHDPAPFIKAATALLLGHIRREDPRDIVRRAYGGDRRIDSVPTRAALTPHTTSSLDEFTQTQGAEAIAGLGPASAMAAAFSHDAAIKLDFERNTGIYIGNISGASGNASFLGEGLPVPVRELPTDSAILVPRKVAVIVPFTREIAEHSIPVFQAIVQVALADSITATIDAIALDATPGDSVRPSGLRAG